MESFDYFKFKKEINGGDLGGLEYLEKTVIETLKEKNKNATDITREDYLIDLFYAVKSLNSCNNIYEITDKARHFNYDLYFNARDLLLEELGLTNLWD